MKLACFVAIVLFTISPILAASTYFPEGTVSDLEQTWYGDHLSAMKEPVLTLSADDKDYFALRILYLPTWGRPIALRIERKNSVAMRRVVMLSGNGGYEPGEILQEKQADIISTDFGTILENAQKSGLWELPPKDNVLGLDGSQLVIEAVRDGRHLVFIRWTPEYDTTKRGLTALVAFYARLFQASGLGKEADSFIRASRAAAQDFGDTVLTRNAVLNLAEERVKQEGISGKELDVPTIDLVELDSRLSWRITWEVKRSLGDGTIRVFVYIDDKSGEVTLERYKHPEPEKRAPVPASQ